MKFKLPPSFCRIFILLLVASTSSFGQTPSQTLPTQTAETHTCNMDFTLEENGVDCNEETGSITVTITGGTAPFDIRWDNDTYGIWGMTTTDEHEFTIENLKSGFYYVDVFDDAGCYLKKQIYVTDQDNTLGLEITVLSTPCDLTGTVNVKVDNSMPPYWLIVSGPIEPTGFYVEVSDFNIINLPVSGTYEIRVIMGECKLSRYVNITVADELLDLDLSIDDETNGILTSISGGHPPYRVYLNNLEEGGSKILTTSEGGDKLIQNVVPGPYEVIIIDAEMCTDTVYIEVPMMMGMGMGMGPGDRVTLNNNATTFDASDLAIHQVFPNPAVEQINFTISTGDHEQVKVIVRDLLGRIVGQQYYQGTHLTETSSIPLSNLSKGLYLLELNTEQEVITQKFLKQ